MDNIYIIDTTKEINCNTRLTVEADCYNPEVDFRVTVDWVFKDDCHKIVKREVDKYLTSKNFFLEYLTQIYFRGKLLRPSDWFPWPDTTWVNEEGEVL